MKREIMMEDINFLKQLQEKMNTQDHVCQAAPRFWVVRGTVKEFGADPDYADGCIIFEDNDVLVCNMKEAFEYLKRLQEKGFDISDLEYDEEVEKITLKDEDGEEETIFNLEELVEFLDNDELAIHYYKNVKKIFENTMFITNDSCKEHIRANYYHYPKDAHSYAMTAWRSPEVDILWKIVENIDWSQLESLLK